MKKTFTTKVMAEVALFSAIAFALDVLQGGLWRGVFINGGSIGFAMLPILIITFRRGMGPGFICGLIVSFLQMLGGIYAIASSWWMVMLQIFLDYILAYPLVAIAGIFYHCYHKAGSKKQKICSLALATFIGGMLKLACHYAAGVIFWSYTCPENYFGGPAVYSLVYNGSYMLPNIIVNGILLILLALKQPKFFLPSDEKRKEIA